MVEMNIADLPKETDEERVAREHEDAVLIMADKINKMFAEEDSSMVFVADVVAVLGGVVVDSAVRSAESEGKALEPSGLIEGLSKTTQARYEWLRANHAAIDAAGPMEVVKTDA